MPDGFEAVYALGVSDGSRCDGTPHEGRFDRLVEAVLEASKARTWLAAVQEWGVTGCEEDVDCGGTCVCGQTHLRYLFEIRNRVTDVTLFPIGSVCIRQFGRTDLDDEVLRLRRLMRLADGAARLGRGHVVGIKSGLFSRALIDQMHEEGAFGQDDPWGRNRDYERLRRLFGAHGHDQEREREAEAIIRRCVYPYLRDFWRSTRPGVTGAAAALGCA